MPTRVNRHYHVAQVRSRRGTSESVWISVSQCLFSCGMTRHVRENMDYFDFNLKTDPGIMLLDRADPKAGRWRPEERAPQGTACISPRGRRGSKGHRAGITWKMTPSAARVPRVACVARGACTTQSRYSKKPLRTELYTMGRVRG